MNNGKDVKLSVAYNGIGNVSDSQRTSFRAEPESFGRIERCRIDRLVKLGIIKGKGGEGENLEIDLGEDAIRLLIFNDRAGLYPKA